MEGKHAGNAKEGGCMKLQRILQIPFLSPVRIIALGFAAIILTGALLLCLPFATRSGDGANFIDALFTATSATCVTGLIVVDTYSFWSPFGQVVILMLIQVGGLGFMTVATLLSFVLRRTISLRERLLMVESFNQNNIQGIVRLARYVIIGTLMFEGIGAVILSFRFIPDFGVWGGITKGIFHSVSAFCNAGFDLMGEREPFSSLMHYQTDFVVNYTIMGLIVVGGLGFAVWQDILKARRLRDLSVHTRMVLIITVGLILTGMLVFLLLEFNNPGTLGPMKFGDKMNAALFQSVTTRTAGYNTIDQGAMTNGSKFLSAILMFIGGSPGSTAGGIKTVTFGILLLSVLAVVRGSTDVNVFTHRIPIGLVLRSLSVLLIAAAIVIVGTMILCVCEDASFIDILMETTSAFGTVGLTAGLTTDLSVVSKVTLTLMMFMGRIGVLTMGMALAMRAHDNKQNIRYPEAKVFVG